MELIFEYPLIWLIPAALVAGTLTYFLYRNDQRNANFTARMRGGLALLRFAAFMIIAFLLLKPLLKATEREEEAPLLLIAQDNSSSLVLNADSGFYRTEWPNALRGFVDRLSENYEVRSFSFGDGLTESIDSIDYSDLTTDVSELLDGVYNRFSNRNVGAIVIASDGIYNSGTNPLYGGKRLDAPIYTIALGDSTQRRDVRIVEVAANKLAYLGNRFPIEIVTEGRKAEGTSTRITIEHDGKIVFNEALSFDKPYVLDTRRAIITADKAGLQRYVISVASVENEVTLRNNRREVFIDVIENRQKILILGAAPHPDLAAIRKATESNLTYEVTVAVADEFEGDYNDFGLVVLHRMPSANGKGRKIPSDLLAAGRPFLLIMGSEMDDRAFNDLKIGYSIDGYRSSLTDVSAAYAKGFTYFQVSDEAQRMFRELPPLQAPFGDFQSAPGVVSLLNRRLGNLETSIPLVSFNQVNGNKVGVIGGEGIWRWRMVAYLQNNTHDVFDRWFSGIVQYLANRDDRKRFRVNAPRELFENDRLVFQAEVYNANYEAFPDADISLDLTNEQGEVFSYGFSRSVNNYRYDAGSLPPGDYTWSARTNVGGEQFTEAGTISIKAIQLEAASTEANHKLLNDLAVTNGGAMYMPDRLNELEAALRSSDDIVTLSFERSRLSDLINVTWLLIALIVLLATEWLLRKWSGNY